MRKKNAALLMKSLLIIFALVIALYFQKDVVPQNAYEDERKMDYSGMGTSYNQTGIIALSPNTVFSNSYFSSTSENNVVESTSMPEATSNSQNKEFLSLSTYDYNYSTAPEAGTGGDSYSGTHVTSFASSNAGPAISLAPSLRPVSPNHSSSKNKNNESHPFGTTIASRGGGIGSNPIGPTPDLPMAPPVPSPLDGGTVALLILCASVAVFKLTSSRAYFSKA